jgi:hypothetical protein
VKTILALCAAVLVLGGALLWHALRMPNRYGAFTGAPKVEVADLSGRPQSYLHRTVAVEGTVREQCTSMGCYFNFRAGKSVLRVDLQEIAMNAPRREGRVARVEGQLVPYGGGYQVLATAVEFK